MSDAPLGPSGPERSPAPAVEFDDGHLLAAEQAFPSRLLERLSYPVSYVDADLVYRHCNAAAAATVGLSGDQIIGKTVASIVGADSEVVALLRRVLESGEPYSGTLEFTPPGSTRTSQYRVSYVPDIDGDGRAVGVLTNVVDVTELSESERRFRGLFESMTEGVALHELVYEDEQAVDYRILEVNAAFEAQTGLSAGVVQGRLASELYGSGEAPYLAEYAAVAESGHSTSFETYFGPLQRSFRIGVICPGPGRFATIFEDVTAHKQAEEALRRHAELLDLSFDAIIVWQLGGTIESWNSGAEELYGYSKSEALGRVSHDLLSTIHQRPWPELEATLLEFGNWEGEVRHRTKDGRGVVVSSRHQLIRGGDGVARVVETNRDITDRKRAEAEMQDQLATTNALLEAATSTATLDLDTVLRRLVAIVAERLGRSRVVIHLFESEREMRTVAATDLRVLSVGRIQRLDDYSPELQEASMARAPVVVDFTGRGISKMAARERRRLQVEIVLYVPLLLRERLVGIATIDEPLTYLPFSDRDVELASALAAQAAVAIENARLFEAKEDELNRTAILREVAAAAAGTIDQRELSAQVLSACRERLGAKAGNVYVIDRDASVLDAFALFGFPEELMPQLERMELDEARASARSYLKKEVVMHDSPDLPSGIAERAKAAEVTQDRWVTVPIRARDEVVGSLGLIFPGQRAFGAEEIALCQALADQLGVGLDKARLFEAESHARQEAAQELATTTFLLAAAGELNRWTDLDVLLDGLADIALRATPHGRIHVAVLSDDASHVTFRASRGEDAVPAGTVIPFDQLSAAVQEALTTGRTIAFETVKLADHESGLFKEGISGRPALVVPIVFGGRIVGHIAVDDPTAMSEFTDREIALVEGIASQAAVAVENARLYEAESAAQLLATQELATSGFLLEAAAELNRRADLDAVLTALADVVLRATPHTRVFVGLLAEDHSQVNFAVNSGKDPVTPGTVVPWNGLSSTLREVLTDKKSRIADYQQLPGERRGRADSAASRLALLVPLIFDDRVVGHIALDDPGERREFANREIALVEGIAAHAAVAIENARAYAAETAARMEGAAQEERTRLARDLHDSVTQALFAATLKAEALTLAGDPLPDGIPQIAEEVRRLSRGALAEMRTLLLELRGEALEDVPIDQLLRHLVEAAEGRSGVNVRLTVHDDGQPSPVLNAPIYRITQEALNNVTRHAKASKAWVDLEMAPGTVRLIVGDDGRGFDTSAYDDPTHMGLRSMRERAQELAAQFDVVTELGAGTVITVAWQTDQSAMAAWRSSSLAVDPEDDVGDVVDE
jgi:PAS domain S-box-containing protein